jgi:hypothetical protein
MHQCYSLSHDSYIISAVSGAGLGSAHGLAVCALSHSRLIGLVSPSLWLLRVVRSALGGLAAVSLAYAIRSHSYPAWQRERGGLWGAAWRRAAATQRRRDRARFMAPRVAAAQQAAFESQCACAFFLLMVIISQVHRVWFILYR